ncbi:MAG: hypothetical protein IT580_14225 [Verrucomicrobiales bacterium]|nr:hypothetical protein [Verrucomicrobiales bacterium]
MARTTVVLVVGLLAGCQPSGGKGDPVLVQQHFAGLKAVMSRPDLAVTGAILSKPESQRLRAEVTRKLAAAMPGWFGAGTTAGTNHAVALTPVVDALLEGESFLEVRGDAQEVRSWAWAARVEAAAGLASQELGRVLSSVQGGAAPAAGSTAWELAGTAGAPGARFFSTNGWVVMGRGAGAFDVLRDRLRSGHAPAPALSNLVWRAEADLAAVAKLAGWAEAPPGPVAQWPRVQATAESRHGRVRTQAQLEYARPLGLVLQPWKVPVSVLTDPLVGFTAMQGSENWLSRVAWLADMGVKEWPREFYFWSLASRPWQQYFAGPVSSPTNLMAQVAPVLPVKLLTNSMWQGQSFGLRLTNQARRLELRGLPFFAPFLEAIREEETEMLFGGLFLPAKGAPPAPPELISQVAGRTNLVFYDWEVTGRVVTVTNSSPAGPAGPARRRVDTNQIGRLVQFKHLAQFGTMMSAPVAALPTTPSGEVAVSGSAWIDAVVPALGETVTEVTLQGPSKLGLTRQSQLGFGSLELMYLLRWVENPGFPGWIEPAPLQPRRRPERSGAAAGAPPVPTVPPASPAPKKP